MECAAPPDRARGKFAAGRRAARPGASSMTSEQRKRDTHQETSMTKSKGGGSFRGHNAKTGTHQPIPQANRPPPASVPRIVPRTKASPKGR